MTRLLYGLYCGARCDRLVWGSGRRNLRILAYHGVCEDHLGGEQWMPSFFVTRTAFAHQMRYLRQFGCVLPLAEAVDRLYRGDLPESAVSVTFDDGYANNLHLAYPILRELGVPATIFLATAYTLSGELFPFDRMSLVAHHTQGLAWQGDGRRPALSDYGTQPIDRVVERLEPWWDETSAALSPEQTESLRPLRTGELGAFAAELIDFGAHTHSHCILRNESASRRRREIAQSIELTGSLTGRPAQLFSFPNGRRGDFGAPDKDAVRHAGMKAAVSTSSGTNRPASDRFQLARYSIGLAHSASSFAAEVTGLRSAMTSLVGRV